MSQSFSLIPRGPKAVTVSNTVTVPATGTTELLELHLLNGVEAVSFQVDNITQALDAFVVEGRVHPSASYFTIASAAGDFSAPTTASRVLGASGAPVSLAASASARFDINTSGLHSLRVSASAAVDSAVTTIYASGAAGLTNTNVTLTAGDIQIGAVELKDAATDVRASIVAANTARTTGTVVVATQPIDAAGNVLGRTAANTARTTATLVDPVQIVDAAGGVMSATPTLGTGSNVVGKVGIDQTTPGTTNAVQANVASGGIASGAVAAGAVAVGALVDGADLTQGALADAAVITDTSGSISAKLRGLISLWVTHIGTALAPSAAVVTAQRPAVTQVVSTALEASHVLKASAGQLVQLTIFNSKTSSQYILVMNSTTLPGDGAVTLLFPPIPILASSLLVLDLPAPIVASTGIVVCNSSTGTFTKTIGSADCVFYAQVN